MRMRRQHRWQSGWGDSTAHPLRHQRVSRHSRLGPGGEGRRTLAAFAMGPLRRERCAWRCLAGTKLFTRNAFESGSKDTEPAPCAAPNSRAEPDTRRAPLLCFSRVSTDIAARGAPPPGEWWHFGLGAGVASLVVPNLWICKWKGKVRSKPNGGMIVAQVTVRVQCGYSAGYSAVGMRGGG